MQVATSTGDAQDQYNRTVFEEVYRILKLCWADEAFSYEGEFYKVPSPYAGCPWPAVEMTTTMGAPGEIGNDHLLHKVSVVPKPYQKPHPKLFQAFSLSESTARWCAREGITPVMLISYPELARRNAQAHFEAAQQAGRADIKEPGNDMGGIRQIYIGNSRQEALELADKGIPGYGWRTFWGHYGFYEAFRLPGQEGEIPWTLESMERAHYLYAGTVDDIKRKLSEMVRGLQSQLSGLVDRAGLLPAASRPAAVGDLLREDHARVRRVGMLWGPSGTRDPITLSSRGSHSREYGRMTTPFSAVHAHSREAMPRSSSPTASV